MVVPVLKEAVPGQRAVILLSGGLDSAAVAHLVRNAGYETIALSFEYGQRHGSELNCARKISKSLDISDHRVIALDLQTIGGSALTSDAIEVPKTLESSPGIPITYVPARNTVFLSVALGLAEVVGAFDIFFGANSVDYSGYPDCRPAFVEAFERLANLATQAAVEGTGQFRIHAPLMKMTKSQIIRLGRELGVNFEHTQSCYDPSPAAACGRCDACRLRLQGFETAGLVDPISYLTRT